MKKSFVLVLVMITFPLLCGCTKAMRYSPEEIKDYPPEVQEQIRQGEVAMGMTTQQVRFAWGSPTTINVIAPSQDGRPREEWIYSTLGIFVQKRLLFVEGRLVDIFPEPRK